MWRIVAVLAVAALAGASARAAAAAPPSAEIEAREEQAVAAVYHCFWASVGHPDGTLPPLARSPTYELYFWHQLGEASRELGGLPELSWCRPYFIDPIRRAQSSLLHGAATGHGTFPAAASEREIVAAAEAHGGSARHGLSERVVRAALALAPARSWALSADEALFVVHAAAAVDTMLFFASRWHAYSHAKAIRPSSEEVADSEARFAAHVADAVRRAFGAATGERALLALGLSAGMVIDLHLHRGLSRPEAAALHVRHAPLGLATHAWRIDEPAVAGDIAAIWSVGLGETAWTRQALSYVQGARMAAAPEEAIGRALAAVAPDFEPLSADHLWRQIRQAAAFRQLGQMSAPPVGAGHWSVPHTVGAIIGCLPTPPATAACRVE